MKEFLGIVGTKRCEREDKQNVKGNYLATLSLHPCVEDFPRSLNWGMRMSYEFTLGVCVLSKIGGKQEHSRGVKSQ